MVSFGSIDFNQLKGDNPVMASGPNAWQPRRHRFVWANGSQPDREAYPQIVYNFNTLTSGNVQPMKRGQMNHFRDTPDEPFEHVYVNRTNLNSIRMPIRSHVNNKHQPIRSHVNNNQPVRPLNMQMQRPAGQSWNLFNHKARKAGCGSCGGRR